MKDLGKNKLKELELLALVRNGSKVAFEVIYQRYKSRVYWRIRSKIDDGVIAEELMQDVFIKVWEKRADIDLDKSFVAYLFCIAQSRVVDFCRRAKRDRQMMDNLQLIGTEISEHPMESSLSKNEGEFLLQAIENLPPQRKRIFVLCKLDGKSYEEVSAMIGVSTSTISDHIVKATKSLKNQLIDVNRSLCILFVPFLFISIKELLEKII